METPVKEGEVLELTIESIGKKGDGVAKIDKFVIFVKNQVAAGDVVKVRITTVKTTYAFAEVTE